MKLPLPMGLGGADASPTLTMLKELSSPEKARHAPGGRVPGGQEERAEGSGNRVVSGGHVAPCFRSPISWNLTV